jgi:hypothetical protein
MTDPMGKRGKTMARLFNQEWKKTDLLRRVGHMEQLAGIRLLEAEDGKARGCRILDVWTGTGLRFQVNAERSLDITSCDLKGMSLSWRSAAGLVHPAYYEPSGMGWLRSFSGGLITTCGLDQYGFPSQENGKELGLHGRLSNLPATQVNYRTYWMGDEYILEITGEVRQSTLFDENLVLQRRISTALGSNVLCIEDTVKNENFEPSPHMLLYHFNLGFPLISEDTRLTVQSAEIQPRNEFARAGLAKWDHFQTPTHGFTEMVFIHRPVPDEDGLAAIELTNPKMGLGLRWRYETASLPYLYEWKMMGEGNYVVGIEPSNCNGMEGRAAARSTGQLPILEPGESRNYRIELEVSG